MQIAASNSGASTFKSFASTATSSMKSGTLGLSKDLLSAEAS
jgi:hypothetical protein